ncbi:MAG: porin family protein [Bacteroidota bacterium]|nr:porin family protein [Bacteroidota bacterium]
MKKIIFLLAFALIAQSSFAILDIKIGPKIGYNASKLSDNMDSIKSQMKSGFSFGLFARFGTKVYLQPELYYTTQGGVFSSNVSNWKQNVKMGSLDIPVLVGYSFINKIVNVRIFAGPEASFVLNKSIGETGLTGPIRKADINSSNWYIQAGGGVDVWKLTFDVRYQVGLNEVIKNTGNYSFNTHNNMFVVSLGYKFL